GEDSDERPWRLSRRRSGGRARSSAIAGLVLAHVAAHVGEEVVELRGADNTRTAVRGDPDDQIAATGHRRRPFRVPSEILNPGSPESAGAHVAALHPGVEPVKAQALRIVALHQHAGIEIAWVSQRRKVIVTEPKGLPAEPADDRAQSHAALVDGLEQTEIG